MQEVRKHLFLTMDEVEDSQNVVRSVCQATKHSANPVLPLGRADEWDASHASPWASRTVLYDPEDRLFKCWYNGTDISTDRYWASGYAISEDGVYWTKPRLGLIEYNGSKDNNIVCRGMGPVLKDDDEPDERRRYKAILKGPEPQEQHGIRAAYSPDGIHWTEQAPFIMPEWVHKTPDIVVFLKDHQDPNPERRYKLVWQQGYDSNKPGLKKKVRAKCLAFSPDGEHFTASRDNPFLHPNDGPEHENHFLMLAPYEGFWVLPYECGWYAPNDQGLFGQYTADVRLAVSTDGEHFTRVNPYQKLIPRGRHGEWDDCLLVISDKLIILDDTIYLYYCGQGEEWTSWPLENKASGFRFERVGSIRLSRMGLATLRLDGWTCLETADREIPGSATTAPIDLTDKKVRLIVNVSQVQANRSFVQVEVLDAATARPIEGLGQGDCQRIEADSVRAAVTWRDKSLADVRANRIKLRFCISGAARLHSWSLAAR